MNFRIPALLILAILLTACKPSVSPQASESCANLHPQGQAPQLTNPKLQPQTQHLCYTAFALLHSGLSRTSLWSAEHLTQSSLQAARAVDREDAFEADPNLSGTARSELRDYVRSGFDRGHLAPAADMPTKESQKFSFYLSNMIPQHPENNRGIWSHIERSVRDYAQRAELYVVTGPLFEGSNLQQLQGRVLVPTFIWKAIYDPKTQQAGVYLTPNGPGDAWKSISLDELEVRSGVRVFPHLQGAARAEVFALPPPNPGRSRR